MNINLSAKSYLFLILLFSIIITWPLFVPGFFFHHDDLQVMRIFEMKKCFEDLQIPCRWVPDMGYGNGFPLFNYYSALPYYIGAALSFGLGFVNAAKALFFIPLVLGGVAMFFLGQKLFGKEAGFLAGILYLFAPYRALDAYVRGAIAESFALAIIPLVFYFIAEIIENPNRKNFVFGSFSLAAFLLSHNIMTMFFMPFVLLWGIIFLYLNKWKNWKAFLYSLVLGTSLAGFFLIPVFLEKDLVQTETLLDGGTNFRTHFVSVGQLFLDRSWGYGGSFFGPNDTISFQIGWPHWWLVVLAIPFIAIGFRKNIKNTLIATFFLLMFLISVIMQHNKSAFIWEAIGPVQYAQFPWRFLSLSILASSVLGGFILNYFGRFKLIVLLIVVITTVLLNWTFFHPREFYPWINDKNKLEDPLWEMQQKASILDYLPKTAQEPPSRASHEIAVLGGNAKGSNYNVRSNRFSADVKVFEKSYIEIPIFDFPNWTIYVNGQQIEHTNHSFWGRMVITLEPGDYQITGKFKDTWVRTAGNTLTLFAAGILLAILLNKKAWKYIYKNER